MRKIKKVNWLLSLAILAGSTASVALVATNCNNNSYTLTANHDTLNQQHSEIIFTATGADASKIKWSLKENISSPIMFVGNDGTSTATLSLLIGENVDSQEITVIAHIDGHDKTKTIKVDQAFKSIPRDSGDSEIPYLVTAPIIDAVANGIKDFRNAFLWFVSATITGDQKYTTSMAGVCLNESNWQDWKQTGPSSGANPDQIASFMNSFDDNFSSIDLELEANLIKQACTQFMEQNAKEWLTFAELNTIIKTEIDNSGIYAAWKILCNEVMGNSPSDELISIYFYGVAFLVENYTLYFMHGYLMFINPDSQDHLVCTKDHDALTNVGDSIILTYSGTCGLIKSIGALSGTQLADEAIIEKLVLEPELFISSDLEDCLSVEENTSNSVKITYLKKISTPSTISFRVNSLDMVKLLTSHTGEGALMIFTPEIFLTLN